jgi:hypothetical protein
VSIHSRRTNYLLAILCFFIIGIEGKTQTVDFAKNSIYFELGGNGGLYSINYERIFFKCINCRVGFSYFSQSWGFSPGTIKTKTFPITITWSSGHAANHFETGGGVLIGTEHRYLNSSNDFLYDIFDITAFLGYRYQPQGEGYLFRVGLAPFLPFKREYPWTYLSGGISLGLHF